MELVGIVRLTEFGSQRKRGNSSQMAVENRLGIVHFLTCGYDLRGPQNRGESILSEEFVNPEDAGATRELDQYLDVAVEPVSGRV